MIQHVSPAALTIAGSDSGGGAGIQADLRAFRAFHVHGCTAITALTAQNPHHVLAIEPTSPTHLDCTLTAVFEDFTLGAIKTGMLLNAELITVVHQRLLQHPEIPLVIDPVMIATSGRRLLSPEAIEALKSFLPLATVLTPNIFEAAALLEVAPETVIANLQSEQIVAQRLAEKFGCAVLLKGGHAMDLQVARDLLCDASGTLQLFETPRVSDPLTTHGTGCTLSAAIAANLALKRSLPDAITAAKNYLQSLLLHTLPCGQTAVYDPQY